MSDGWTDQITIPNPGDARLSWDVSYRFTPGDPGCRYMANGDPGWPPTGPEIEILEVVDGNTGKPLTAETWGPYLEYIEEKIHHSEYMRRESNLDYDDQGEDE